MTEDDRPLHQGHHEAVATTAATDAHTVPAELAHLPLEDVTLVLLVSGRRRRPLKRWARRINGDPDLSRCRVLVVRKGAADPESEADAEADLESDLEAESETDPDDEGLLGPDPLADLDIVQLAETPEPDESDIVEGYARIFDSVTTPWFIVTSLPRRRLSTYKQRLKGHIAREIERVGEIGLSVDRPVMLYNRDRSKVAPRAHLRHELAELGPDPDRVHSDYLAFLALATGTVRLEGVDLRSTDRELELFARVSLGRFNSHEQPPCNYRFVVATSSREVLTEQTAHLEQRLDNQGGRRWENVVGRLRVDDIPEGNHLVMIGVDTPFAALRTLQALQPRAGVLAPARTVLLRGEGQGRAAAETRYLMHTVRGTATWITLQRGLGAAARRRWGRSMVRKDARAILKGRGGRRMRLARLVRLATRPFYARREIWLVGERADTAQDNGFHLFRHLRESQPDREVYYIIDADSPQRSRVEHLGNVVDHSSASHRMLMMHASVLANAYSIKHMIPRQWTASGYTRGLAWRVGAHRVYLKHGVHVSPTAVKRGTGGYDLYLSVNPMEREALRESSGYRDQVLETGMPRYDTLVPTPPSRTILFMPTWRRYLAPTLFSNSDETQVAYEGSTYERFMIDFLGSERLALLLEAHDLRLQVVPHYNLRTVLRPQDVAGERVDVLDAATADIPALLRSCDLLVTDYSSVQFDVAYVGTPMVYCQFDEGEYTTGHSAFSWFDPRRDGFGPVTCDADSTVSAIEHYAERGFVREAGYDEQVSSVFAYQDHDNCERLVESIDSLTRTDREPGPRPGVRPG